MVSFGFSHAWLLLCNLSIFAVTICILASCRTVSESKYSLINIDRNSLTTAFEEDCVNASSHIPDLYKVGLSGACRVTDGETDCTSHLPPSLNWAKLFEADLVAANDTGSQATIRKQCVELIDKAGVNHGLSDRIAAALLALLVISIIVNIITLVVALLSDSAFGILVFVPAFIDEVILVVCLGLYLGIINHEVGEYIPGGKMREVSDMSILGVGFWMLLGIFCVRVISSPGLFVVTLLILLSIPLACLSLLLCMCGGGSTVSSSTVYITEYVFI